MAEIDDESPGYPDWKNKSRMNKVIEKTNKNSLVNRDLSEFEKLAILTMLQTGNAHQSYSILVSNAEAEKKDFKNSAVRTMQNLMERPKSQDYINQIRSEIEKKTQVSKEELVDACWKIMNVAKDNMDYASAVRSLALITKIEGLISKTVVDINKTINIRFGGGFDPSQLPLNNLGNTEYKEIEPDLLEEKSDEKFQIKDVHQLKIKDENQGDDRMLNF